MATLFVPPSFTVPLSFDGPGFRLEPLGPQHNERDHEAWMSSIDHIRSTPGYSPSDDWPTPMPLEANREDLVMHAEHFAAREGFTYSIVDGEDVIGCLYIYPSKDPRHDATIRSWVRASRAPMDGVVRSAIAGWIEESWPFTNPSYAADVNRDAPS